MCRFARWTVPAALILSLGLSTASRPASGAVTREEVERAIREGVRFLKSQQRHRRVVDRS